MSLPLSELYADLARLRSNLFGDFFDVMSELPFIRSQALSVALFLIVGPWQGDRRIIIERFIAPSHAPRPDPDRLKEMASDET